ncbi:M23 family metallopeptidase [Mycetocola reblochoni]
MLPPRSRERASSPGPRSLRIAAVRAGRPVERTSAPSPLHNPADTPPVRRNTVALPAAPHRRDAAVMTRRVYPRHGGVRPSDRTEAEPASPGGRGGPGDAPAHRPRRPRRDATLRLVAGLLALTVGTARSGDAGLAAALPDPRLSAVTTGSPWGEDRGPHRRFSHRDERTPPDGFWPVEDARVLRAFDPPASDFGPGHRGVDLGSDDSTVMAIASGTVSFVGCVAGTPVVSVDHGHGRISSYLPVDAAVRVGERLDGGERLGRVVGTSHLRDSPPGCDTAQPCAEDRCADDAVLHLGLRVDGVYRDPLLVLEPRRHARLLPSAGG